MGSIDYNSILQWASPIIAVLLAWWTIRSSAKDTKKQVDAIKRLSILQAEISIIQNEIEVYKNKLKLYQAQQSFDDFHYSEDSILAHQLGAQQIMMTQQANKQLEIDLKYYRNLQNKLQEKQKQLVSLKKELEELK